MNKNTALVTALAVSLSGSVLVWAEENNKKTEDAPPTSSASSANTPAGTTDADRTQRILEPLPANEPAPAEPAAPSIAQAAPVSDPSTSVVATTPPTDAAPVTLAPVVVESPAPALTDSNVLTTKGAGAAARERQFTGETDRALNTFTLPLVGQTPEQRALAKERDEQRLAAIDDTKRVLTTLDSSQPEEAASLKKEINEISVRNDLIEDTTPSTLRRE